MTARQPPSPRAGPGRTHTHYQTLGVGPRATAEEIRRAYRALAKKHHPDTGPAGSAAAFAAIAAAYETLSDPALRRAYDESLSLTEKAERAAHDTRAHYAWGNIAAPRTDEPGRGPGRAEFDDLYDTFYTDRGQSGGEG
jgi:curved DNA-binding protein CbpA